MSEKCKAHVTLWVKDGQVRGRVLPGWQTGALDLDDHTLLVRDIHVAEKLVAAAEDMLRMMRERRDEARDAERCRQVAEGRG